MRLRMKMRVLIVISVISVAMLVLIGERLLRREIQLWLTLEDKEINVPQSNDERESTASRTSWKHVILQTRKEDTIYHQINHDFHSGMTAPPRGAIEVSSVPQTSLRTNAINFYQKEQIKQTKHKEKNKYFQKLLRLDKVKHYVRYKLTRTKSIVKNTDVKLLKTECPKWKHDKQDWTIMYHGSHNQYDSKSCPKPSYGKSIKRILFNDGTFVNTGCNKNTRECKEYPFYDFKEGVRINAPPCCRQHVLTMFDHVTTELKRQGISHCMISGGVIGWVRNKKMIPYDRDLDLIIQSEYWNTTGFWGMFERLNKKYGYVANDVEEFKVKLYLSKLNRNNIDIWAYWAENNTVSIAFHGFKKQSLETMMPFRAVKFEWLTTFVPAKPIHYLDMQYGKEVWRPEKQCMVRNAEGDCW